MDESPYNRDIAAIDASFSLSAPENQTFEKIETIDTRQYSKVLNCKKKLDSQPIKGFTNLQSYQ